MLLSIQSYQKIRRTEFDQISLFPDEDLGKPILQMPDFNSLIALSQKHKAPIFDLTDAQLERDGIVLEQTKASMRRFRELYSEGADRIITLIENA